MSGRVPEETAGLTSGRGSTLRVRAATLDVISGPDDGRRGRIESPLFVVGTGAGADMRLSDSSVSREHVRFGLETGGIRMTDDGSRNGTWVGGLRIAQALVTADVVVEIGKTTLRVRLDATTTDLPVSDNASFGEAVSVSPSMRHVFATLERVAPSDLGVLIEGETGVGKELLAQGVHTHSLRRDGPFVTLDCGAISPQLVESELFGYERGAFTGAVASRQGVFERASGGTLFLDEVGELPIDLQPKLLRALEQREIRPVGGSHVRTVDVRIVAATNRRLSEAVRSGEFRSDLFYRLAVARVVVPALRDRPEDVPFLARTLLRKATQDAEAELPADLESLLLAYKWPGNVRELRNVMSRYAYLDVSAADELFDTEAPDLRADLSQLPYEKARRAAIDRFEREYLPKVLERAGGAVAKAAALAEVARPSFYRMLERVRGSGGRGG